MTRADFRTSNSSGELNKLSFSDKEAIKPLLIGLVKKIALILIGGYLLFHFVFGFMIIKRNDMAPSVKAGDAILFYRLSQTYKVEEAVVYEDSKTSITKVGRIIAQAGDEVDLTEQGELKINGHIQNEGLTFIKSREANYPYRIADNSYLILNDYYSQESENYLQDTIAKDAIKGTINTLIRLRNH
ncbi:TPA: signal peptidase-like pilus assembly factor SipA [Streptococcus pyogenes]